MLFSVISGQLLKKRVCAEAVVVYTTTGSGGLRIVINRPVVLVSLPCVSLGKTFLPLDYQEAVL